MAREDAQLKLRLPADLKAWVESQASKSNRSINAQIVHLIQSAYAADTVSSRVNAAIDSNTGELSSPSLNALNKDEARLLVELFNKVLGKPMLRFSDGAVPSDGR